MQNVPAYARHTKASFFLNLADVPTLTRLMSLALKSKILQCRIRKEKVS